MRVMRSLLNVNSLHHDLHTVHPLPRASILHLQGCLRGRTDPCPGCANQALWSDEGRWGVDPLDLAALIIRLAAAPALSVSGGEPLDQYEPLCHFLTSLKRAGFSILMWTGFEMSQVRDGLRAVLDSVDYLITGPYVEQRKTRGIPFISSSNQEIHCLTPRARKAFQNYVYVHEYEVVIRKDGPSAVCLGGILPHAVLGRP